MATKRYIRLADRADESSSHGTAVDLDTGKLVHKTLPSSGSALRGQIYEAKGKGKANETNRFAQPSQYLNEVMTSLYRRPNGWCVDWPHLATELAGTLVRRTVLEAKLLAMCEYLPYKLKITGLHRRYLMYFSDGNVISQKTFLRMCPVPGASPFDSDGRLRGPFLYGATMAQAAHFTSGNSHIPLDAPALTSSTPMNNMGGMGCRPLLYAGPAWVVRFTLDDQYTAAGGCRVYVRDTGDFICSDWCQRDGVKYYGKGIDLQTGAYRFDTWISGPSVQRAMEQGSFTPHNVTTKIHAVRHLLKNTKKLAVPILKHLNTITKVLSYRDETISLSPPKAIAMIQAAWLILIKGGINKLTAEQRRLLQDVPVSLASTKPWAPEVLKQYERCVADLSNLTNSSFSSAVHVLGYVGEFETCAVEPNVLELDIPRLEAALNAPYAINATALASAWAIAEVHADAHEEKLSLEATVKALAAIDAKKWKNKDLACPVCQVKVLKGKWSTYNKCYQPGNSECLMNTMNITSGPGPVAMLTGGN